MIFKLRIGRVRDNIIVVIWGNYRVHLRGMNDKPTIIKSMEG